MAKDKEEPKDQRTLDREAELAKQREVAEAMEAFYKESTEAARKALKDQQNIEVFGPVSAEQK